MIVLIELTSRSKSSKPKTSRNFKDDRDRFGDVADSGRDGQTNGDGKQRCCDNLHRRTGSLQGVPKLLVPITLDQRCLPGRRRLIGSLTRKLCRIGATLEIHLSALTRLRWIVLFDGHDWVRFSNGSSIRWRGTRRYARRKTAPCAAFILCATSSPKPGHHTRLVGMIDNVAWHFLGSRVGSFGLPQVEVWRIQPSHLAYIPRAWH
jgi:hypothetical protein